MSTKKPVECQQKLSIDKRSWHPFVTTTKLKRYKTIKCVILTPVTKKCAITSLLTLVNQIAKRTFASGVNKLKQTKIMVVTHNVKGYDEFAKKMEELETGDGNNPVHVLFSGGKDENGESWCPYCVKAEPVIHDALKKAAENSHFVHVDVGERSYWKDLNCPFRKDPNTHLIFLPTLLRWKSPQRLDGERCSNKDLVEMMFEDEE